jgi:hypothetical protein
VRGGDATPLGGRMRQRLKGPPGKTSPVGDAAEALVAGVETRARIVAFPRWVRGLLAVRGLVQPLLDLGARPHIAEDDRIALELGPEATVPVGAGGAADRAQAARR